MIEMLLLLCLFCSVSAYANCGQPGHSRKSHVRKDSYKQGGVYKHGDIVFYDCSAPMLADYGRECFDGRWLLPIPKCPQLFRSDNLLLTAKGNQIAVNWKNEAKIVSFRIIVKELFSTVEERNVELKVLNGGVDIFDDMESNFTSLGGYSKCRIIEVRRRSQDIQHLNNSRSMNILFDHTILICGPHNGYNSDTRFCLDKIKLFYLDETIDDCYLPDTPLDVALQQNITQDGIYIQFVCPEGSVEKPSIRPPFCPKNGDWTMQHVEPCIAIYCDPVGIMPYVTEFFPALTTTTFGLIASVGSIAHFQCEQNLSNIAVCLTTGKWSQMPKPCMKRESVSEENLNYLWILMTVIILIIFSLILLAILSKFLRLMKKENIPHSVSQEELFDYQSQHTYEEPREYDRYVGSNIAVPELYSDTVDGGEYIDIFL